MSSNFYVQKPREKSWNTGTFLFVVEAKPLNKTQKHLFEWQKTDEYIQNYLQVVKPSLIWPYIKKSEWTKCNGPVRKLDHEKYVALTQKLQQS